MSLCVAATALGAGAGCGRTGLLVGGEGGADNPTPPSFPACVVDAAEIEVPRLAVYILFDKSESMSWSGQWAGATSALSTFFGNPENGGLDVALRLFPAPGCDADTCDPSGCSKPTVDAAPLIEAAAPVDAHEAALRAAVMSAVPDGNTPMYPAVEGAYLWSQQYRGDTTGNVAVLVLVTDGEPSGCNDHVNDLVELVGDGLAAGTRTFVIGLEGSSEMVDDRITKAGGTSAAYMIGAGDTATALAATLDSIRDSAARCALAVPAELAPIDAATTNVSRVDPAGATTPLARVATSDDCEASGGWYFEDATAETIALCPVSCAEARSGAMDRLFVTQGCASE